MINVLLVFNLFGALFALVLIFLPSPITYPLWAVAILAASSAINLHLYLEGTRR